MSDQPLQPSSSHAVTSEVSSLMKSWRFASIVAGIMILLAMIGVGLTTTNSSYSRHYWVWLVPVYGILCIGTAWSRGSKGLKRDFSGVMQQVFHWLGVGVAISLDFLIKATGEETTSASGLSALLVLALGCYLAGVHLDWLFAIVGVLLTVTVLIIAKAEQYRWLIFVIGAVVLVAIFSWHRIKLRLARRAAS